MRDPRLERWLGLCTFVHPYSTKYDWYARLVDAYSQPQRVYHRLSHLDHVLAESAAVLHLADNPLAVELALWFHDAVYNPKSATNEEDSIALLRSFLGRLTSTALRAEGCIEATRHMGSVYSTDEKLVVDIDLSILGQPPHIYQQYERHVREEYAWVPAEKFRLGRLGILDRFLARPVIYHTPEFHSKYEDQARANMLWAIAQLTEVA